MVNSRDNFDVWPHVAKKLTKRELQVLKIAAKGASNNEISYMLDISTHTVKSHMVSIYNKLSVNNRTRAAVLATQLNLI